MTEDTSVQPETQPAEPTSTPAPPTGEAPAPDRQPGQWTSEALEAQIRRQHRKIKELEQQMQRSTEIEGENRRLREQASASGFVATQQQQQPLPEPAPAPQPNMAELEQQVAFKLRVDDLGRKLEREYGEDWKLAFTNFQKVGVLPPEVLAQAMETDDPAYVLVTLGKDPMKIQEVLDMPPYRRMATLVRMADAKPKPAAEEPPEARLPGIPRPSNAPPPPTGERQRGNSPSLNVSSVYDERLNFQNYYNGDPAAERAADDAYYALRRREKLESTGRPWSIKK